MGWQPSPELKLKWRYDDIRRAQQRRRGRLRRIDYQDVSPEAGKAIDQMRAALKEAARPHSFSAAINAIVESANESYRPIGVP